MFRTDKIRALIQAPKEDKMTKLVIGMEHIEIRAAKQKVSFNLKWLNTRIQSLPLDSAIYDRAYQFYVKKIEEQKGIMEWLNQYDELLLDKKDLAVM